MPERVPDPPRPCRLPDGTYALIVWAGDMVTHTGVKGGLLEPRASHPDRTSQLGPGNMGFSLHGHPDAIARERRRTAERRRKQTKLAQQRRALAGIR